MTYRGYIKTWRKVIESGWLKNHKLWAFWSWCLLKASHKECKTMIGFQEITLCPGQFIFGRKVASKELNLTEQNVRTCLEKLKTMENLTIKTTNKYSIITIINWDIYQGNGFEDNQQIIQQLTNNSPTTNQQLTTNKNDKNDKNKKKKVAHFILPEWIPKEMWSAFLEVRKKKRAANTDYAFKLLMNTLNQLHKDGNDRIKVIEQSIERGWAGFFELKETKQYGTNKRDNPKSIHDIEAEAEIERLNAKFYASEEAVRTNSVDS